MAQDAASFECEPWRWNEGEKGGGGESVVGLKGTLEEGKKRQTGKGGKQM